MALRIGIVGVGFGATVHIPAFQSEGLEVVAVCSRRPERVQEAAAKFGVPNAFTDYDEMLRLPGLDAVSIATPPSLHKEQALAAIAAGKHVMCEKPFALNANEAREMWQAAESSGLTHMIAHEFRFASGRMYAKELIDEGYIGDLRLCTMKLLMGGMGRPGAQTGPGPQQYSRERDSAAMGAGLLFGLGSHYIDALRHWFGEVDSVSGELANFNPDRLDGDRPVKADADDTFSFTLHFANGGIGTMTSSRTAQFGSGAAVEIYGSKGTIVQPQRGGNPPAHGILLAAQTGAEKLEEQSLPERLQPFADDRDDRLMPFRLMTREFVRGVEEGTSPAPNFYDGYRCQQVLDAVRESAAMGHRVVIDGD